MHKKLIITASILLLAGGATLAWALDQRRKDREEIAGYKERYSVQTDDFVRHYNGWLQTPPEQRAELPLLLDENGKAKSRELLRREQHGRFMANVDKLVAGVATNPSLADLLYGENWQEELTRHKERRASNKLVLTGSIVTVSAGGSVYLLWILFVVARLIVKAANGLKGRVGHAPGGAKEDEADEPNAEGALQDLETKEDPSEPEARPKVAVKPVEATAAPREHRTMGSLTQRPKTAREKGELDVLITDRKSVAVDSPTAREPVRLDLSEPAKPIDNTLTDLTEQVSAIREYAANQQDRLEKLQDGYDWNIIRTFCLRVIRCIDNIETRIAQLAKKGAARKHLEEIRDELIFALESSGIEQFEPETETEYRGQEKLAEAVKDKVSCDNPEQAGKIANVVRPGYQYFINEGNVKIVRPAQVKLYA